MKTLQPKVALPISKDMHLHKAAPQLRRDEFHMPQMQPTCFKLLDNIIKNTKL